MFKKKTWLAVLAALALVVLAACGGEESGDSDDTEKEEAPSSITLGSASQGGTYYIYAGGLASIFDEKLDVPTNVEVTGGPVHNMQMVQSGDLTMGLATLGPAYEGYTGEGEWTNGEKLDDVRIAFPMYTTPIIWWSPEGSGIESIEDVKGQRIGVGPSGGTSGTYLPIIHEALELDTDDVQAGASDMTSQMLDGQLDVIGFAAGTPIAAVTELEAQRDLNIFSLTEEQREQVFDMYPYFTEHTVSADAYDSLDEDLETIAMFNFGIVNKSMNSDFVYEMVKTYHESQEELMNTHSAAKEAVEEAILINEEVPLHKGAIKYYEEQGIDLPDSVYPPEYDEE